MIEFSEWACCLEFQMTWVWSGEIWFLSAISFQIEELLLFSVYFHAFTSPFLSSLREGTEEIKIQKIGKEKWYELERLFIPELVQNYSFNYYCWVFFFLTDT